MNKLVRIELIPGKNWRGVTYCMWGNFYDLSPEYAKHVVETLKVARYA